MLIEIEENHTPHLRQVWEVSVVADSHNDGALRVFLSGMRWYTRAPKKRKYVQTGVWFASYNARRFALSGGNVREEERPEVPPHVVEMVMAALLGRIEYTL